MHANAQPTLGVCRPEAAAGEHYIDAEAFQSLFADAPQNFQKISEAIFLMANRIVQTIHFDHAIDREDAVANVVLQAMEHANRHRRHTRDAFRFYSEMIFTRLLNERRGQTRYARRFRTGVELEHELGEEFEDEASE